MYQNDSEADWNLVARVISGEATAEERARLQHWVGSDAQRVEMIRGMERGYNESRVKHAAVDIDAALARIKASPAGDRVLRISRPSAPRRLFPMENPAHWGVAAAILLLVGAGAGVYAARRSERSAVTAAPTISEVMTRKGERARVRLPDGTEAVLAPGSVMRYSSEYGVAERRVTLEGQALFRVRHDEGRPFVVHTNGAAITDLGTEFVATQFREDSSATVVVTDGKVSLAPAQSPVVGASASAPAKGTVLRRGDLGRANGSGEVAVKHGVSLARYTAFVEGRLVFEDTPLREVAMQLSRWFDVDAYVIDESIGGLHLTASYHRESVGEVAKLIAATLDIRVEREGRTILFRGRKEEGGGRRNERPNTGNR